MLTTGEKTTRLRLIAQCVADRLLSREEERAEILAEQAEVRRDLIDEIVESDDREV
jgi:hypothetical protein